jgi:hypothetical protein
MVVKMLNKKQKEYCNFNENIKCKDLKIAVFEYNASELFDIINVLNPFNTPSNDIFDKTASTTNNHVFKVCSIIRDMCPNAEIVFLPQNDNGIKYAIENKFHIACFSGDNMFADDKLEKELAKKTFLITSAGNVGEKGETTSARNDWWYSIGACRLENNKPVIELYSSYGLFCVDNVSFSQLQYQENSEIIYGTSFSAPFFTGLVSQYMQIYYNTFSYFPTVQETISFIKSNSIVISDKIKEGYGFFTLPKVYNLGCQLIINSNELNKNGTIINIPIAPKLEDGNTIVPLGVLRHLGLKLYWDGENKRIIINT